MKNKMDYEVLYELLNKVMVENDSDNLHFGDDIFNLFNKDYRILEYHEDGDLNKLFKAFNGDFEVIYDTIPLNDGQVDKVSSHYEFCEESGDIVNVIIDRDQYNEDGIDINGLGERETIVFAIIHNYYNKIFRKMTFDYKEVYGEDKDVNLGLRPQTSFYVMLTSLTIVPKGEFDNLISRNGFDLSYDDLDKVVEEFSLTHPKLDINKFNLLTLISTSVTINSSGNLLNPVIEEDGE